MTLAARPFRIATAVVVIIALAVGAFWIVSARGADPESEADIAVREAGFDASERAAIEALVRDYLLEHPEILPEIVQKLREKQSLAAMEGIRDELFSPYPGAVLGNPRGSKVLVEFSDYACGYCRHSVEAVDALIAEDPDLKVVVREFPILSEDSVAAAKMALAAAHQGKYEEFHKAMYETGRPTEANIEKAAKAAGLDLAKARQAAASPAIAAEIEANRAFASQLEFSGTPAWVTATQTLQGAVGKEALSEALSAKGG
ncbi:DsbA family protein [Croceicoccus bisphenolivorans]|uniref:DsbA family protein n=1 Tax=Croceicoccus bisphenolivorans TaxID=1783232 RepID=UPI000836EE85|nr:DsbA family protein [Croceicoccus bisphenolivorans]